MKPAPPVTRIRFMYLASASQRPEAIAKAIEHRHSSCGCNPTGPDVPCPMSYVRSPSGQVNAAVVAQHQAQRPRTLLVPADDDVAADKAGVDARARVLDCRAFQHHAGLDLGVDDAA